MKIKYGKGQTKYGPGVDIELSGTEIANAILAYIVSCGAHIDGPRTITVNGELIYSGRIYVDPAGFVIAKGKKFCGNKSLLGDL